MSYQGYLNDKKVILTVATTGGVHGKDANPNLPEQPDEIASQIRECEKLGAAIVHVHGRDEHGENDASRRQDVNIANGSPLTLRSRQAVKASLRGSIVAFATRCIALSNPSYWRNRTSPAAYSVSGRYRHCHRKPCSTSSIIPPKTVKSVSTLASDTNARWRRSLRFCRPRPRRNGGQPLI